MCHRLTLLASAWFHELSKLARTCLFLTNLGASAACGLHHAHSTNLQGEKTRCVTLHHPFHPSSTFGGHILAPKWPKTTPKNHKCFKIRLPLTASKVVYYLQGPRGEER